MMRRKLTRQKSKGARRQTRSYDDEEEEEGYASGDYDDGPFEMIKIRVKIHLPDEIRGMTLDPLTPWPAFKRTLEEKFGDGGTKYQYKFVDEDGGKVTLRDESDYDLAIETARELGKGKPEGKLQIYAF